MIMHVQCGLAEFSISAKKRLQIVQNKVIKFVLGIPPRTHLGCSEFSRVNILPVKCRTGQIKLNHMLNGKSSWNFIHILLQLESEMDG